MSWIDKAVFAVAIVFFIAALVAFALSLDRYTFEAEEKEKESKFEKTKLE